jgi:hypothetical protein
VRAKCWKRASSCVRLFETLEGYTKAPVLAAVTPVTQKRTAEWPNKALYDE